MTRTQKGIGIFFGIILIASAIGHLVNPDFSSGFIPDFLPKTLVHVLTSIVEAVLGIGVFIPNYRKKALTGIFILMILFLPLHIQDVFREEPVVGSLTGALIRLPVQLLLILMAWYARK
jgi:uncharacterized membrane protein